MVFGRCFSWCLGGVFKVLLMVVGKCFEGVSKSVLRVFLMMFGGCFDIPEPHGFMRKL